MTHITTTWVDGGVKPRCPADPKYPNGIDVDLTAGRSPYCVAKIPYPAPRVGGYVIDCKTCGQLNFITTAGRADDPRSVKLPCRSIGNVAA